jgi:hypothetical protein
MKKQHVTKASLLIALLSGGLAQAEETKYIYNLAVNGNVTVPEWIRINNIYGSWNNVGSAGGCGAWTPSPASIDYGDTFQQGRICQQAQQRTVVPILFNPVLQTTRNGDMEIEDRSVNVSQYQPSVGERDYINGESADVWGEWVSQGARYACSNWDPEPDTVNLYVSFQQNRDCSQNQTRSRQVYDTWASGAKTPKRVDGDAQTISVVEVRAENGLRDFIDGERIAPWSIWEDSGRHFGCVAWSPAVDTINLNQSFTQSRDCSQNQIGSREIFDVWASGVETLNRIEPRAKVITESETQSALGTKDYITSTSYGSWSGYSNVNGAYACSGYSPDTSTVSWGSSFTQSRSCSQNQSRSRTIYDVWASGASTVQGTGSDDRTISVTQNRAATGSNDYIASTSYGSWSSYSNVGGAYNCSGYTPSPSAVNWGTRFTQSRSCSQNQNRLRSTYNVWASGARTAKGTESGTRTVSVTQVSSATGTKDYIAGTSVGAWSNWSNSGGLYGCGAWGAAASTVNYGQSFTQYRSCSQNRVHTRPVYNNWASGARTNKTTESGTVTINVNESKGAVGTKNIISGAQSSSGAWVEVSTACGGWTPYHTTVNYGSSYTQVRSCATTSSRTNTVYDVWADGSRTVKSSTTESKSVPFTDTRSATGSKDYITGTYETFTGSSRSSWSCPSWSPNANLFLTTQTVSQSRTCTSVLTRYYSVYNRWAKGGSTLKQSNKAVPTNDSTVQVRTVRGTQIPYDDCGPILTQCR